MIHRLALMGVALALAACAPAKPQPKTSPAPRNRAGSGGDITDARRSAPAVRSAPARRVAPVLPRRRAAQKGRAWLGVYLGSDGQPGILVRKVHPGSPAAKAGLKTGDRILTINNAALPSVRALQQEVASFRPGDKVALDVRRSGKALKVVVLLERLLTYGQRVRQALVGKPAPAFTVTRIGGPPQAKTISASAMKGKLWLLEFWATWCGACRAVIPMLKKIHAQYGPYGLHIVSIAKDKPARVTRMASLLKLPYIVGVDPRGKVLSKYLINPIPAFMLINAKGVVIDVAVGRTWVVSFRRMLKTAHRILTKKLKPLPATGRPRPAAGRPRP